MEVCSADTAMALLMEAVSVPGTEEVALEEALGRVLGEDVTASLPVPPFARSAYDGYALRSGDTACASPDQPVTLTVLEETAAGETAAAALEEGCAVKILTGAPVPPGADAVVPYEHTTFSRDWVRVDRPCPPGNIVPVGEDVAAGARIARRGTRIDGPLLGMLAAQGMPAAAVFRRPAVSLIATGSELVAPGRPLSPGKIYNTNFFLLSSLLREMGAAVRNGRAVPDDPAAIAAAVRGACAVSELVITTGGASVGDCDYMPRVLEGMGGRILFRKVALKPGGSMLAALVEGTPVLCLSGNPGAAAVGLLRVGAPCVKRLCERRDVFWPEMVVRLAQAYPKASPRPRVLRGSLVVRQGEALFDIHAAQANGAVSSLMGCDLLAEIPAGSPPLPAGTPVKAYGIGR